MYLELVQSLQDIVSTAVSRNELEQYVYAKFHCAHVSTLMLRCRHHPQRALTALRPLYSSYKLVHCICSYHTRHSSDLAIYSEIFHWQFMSGA